MSNILNERRESQRPESADQVAHRQKQPDEATSSSAENSNDGFTFSEFLEALERFSLLCEFGTGKWGRSKMMKSVRAKQKFWWEDEL